MSELIVQEIKVISASVKLNEVEVLGKNVRAKLTPGNGAAGDAGPSSGKVIMPPPASVPSVQVTNLPPSGVHPKSNSKVVAALAGMDKSANATSAPCAMAFTSLENIFVMIFTTWTSERFLCCYQTVRKA
jgi:hypothetical protein